MHLRLELGVCALLTLLSTVGSVGCIRLPEASPHDAGRSTDADAGVDTARPEPDTADAAPPRDTASLEDASATSLTLPEDPTLFEGESVPLTVDLAYSDGSAETVDASQVSRVNTNPEVATLMDGQLIARRRGTTSIVFDLDDADGERAVLDVTVEFGFDTLVAGGYHTCGLSTAGEAYCWGHAGDAQVGTTDVGSCEFQFFRNCELTCDGCCSSVIGCSTAGPVEPECRETSEVECARSPVRVPTDGRFTQLAAGYFHTCGLTTDDRLLCWGNSSLGELGDPAQLPEEFDVIDVTPSFDIDTVYAGVYQTCVVASEDGMVHCIGWNAYGQLGTPADDSATCDGQRCIVEWSPLGFGGSNGVAVLYLGTCAADEAGTARCVGRNSYGYFRDLLSTVDLSYDPVELTGAYERLVGAVHHLCGRRSDGLWECWGWNGFGQIDTTSGELATTPSLVGGFDVIAAGAYHTCGVRDTGEIECWGRNEAGQLGRITAGGDGGFDREPISGGGETFTHVTAGITHTCAIEDATRQAYCWGANPYGQLGDGRNDNSPEVYRPAIRRVAVPPP